MVYKLGVNKNETCEKGKSSGKRAWIVRRKFVDSLFGDMERGCV